MRLFDKILKRNEKEQEQKLEQVEEKSADINLPQRYKREGVKQRYPHGLPLNILKNLDYSKYGVVLKQQQLLPPSYDRKPVGVEVMPSEHGDHNIKLIFKSKTSASYRIISIRGYDVSMSTNNASIHFYMPIMSREWENFCERVAYCADRGISYSRVNDFTL